MAFFTYTTNIVQQKSEAILAAFCVSYLEAGAANHTKVGVSLLDLRERIQAFGSELDGLKFFSFLLLAAKDLRKNGTCNLKTCWRCAYTVDIPRIPAIAISLHGEKVVARISLCQATEIQITIIHKFYLTTQYTEYTSMFNPFDIIKKL